MKVGVLPVLDPQFGGSFQYSLSMVEAVAQIGRDAVQAPRFTLLVRPGQRSALPHQDAKGWEHIVDYGSIGDRIGAVVKKHVGHGQMRDFLARARRLGGQVMARTHGTPEGIEWVLYTCPDLDCLAIDIPFVMPIFDLQHRQQPEFPEVSAAGVWDERERLYRYAARRAVFVIADSVIGKEDFLECYAEHGITEDRVKVLPSVPAPYLSAPVPAGERTRVRGKYGLPARYFFYPAQFWPHKNHLRIVQALAWMSRERGIEAHVVFGGSHGGSIRTQTFGDVIAEVHRSRIADRVHYIGYVPNEDMAGLYAEARGLVMPTFFGPTNIPVVEAWMFGCPVLSSDLRGIREQVGDAGILADPRSVQAIGEAMALLWEDDALCSRLAGRGAAKLAAYGPNEFRATLASIIEEAGRRIAARGGEMP